MRQTRGLKRGRIVKAEKRLRQIHCPNCGGETKIMPAGTVYKRGIPGKIREVLVCNGYPDCDSYVSVNSGRHQYGIPANREVRSLRYTAHELQAEIISKGLMTHTEIYLLHRRLFQTSPAQSHIRYFDGAMCQQIILHYKRLLLLGQRYVA